MRRGKEKDARAKAKTGSLVADVAREATRTLAEESRARVETELAKLQALGTQE